MWKKRRNRLCSLYQKSEEMQIKGGGMAASDAWLRETKTLADALQPQPPVAYAADGIFPLPSLSIVYGAPGSMKSLLMADLAICVAAGRWWLPPPPNDKSGAVQPFKVTQMPALWLDFDNGARRTGNRLAAFARAYKAGNAPLFYLSLPTLPFDATKPAAVVAMVNYIKALETKFVVIDNLLTISGGRDENAPEIAPVMRGLRTITERTGAAVVVIHHARKQNGIRGRLGDDLRGHSSILGAIDLALLVEREEGADSVTVKSTKSRDVEVEPFGALFTYAHKAGTHDLETASFFGQKVVGIETLRDVQQAIIAALTRAGRPLNQNELVKAVQMSGVKAGRDRIRAIADKMASTIRITKGARGAVLYGI